ncbi:MAG: hypothetical protein HY918_05690 [Candidatus Doudnabacteria bacterium]|nr:hypothetical protein [Candidatus Doudnabacteria bacterium]
MFGEKGYDPYALYENDEGVESLRSQTPKMLEAERVIAQNLIAARKVASGETVINPNSRKDVKLLADLVTFVESEWARRRLEKEPARSETAIADMGQLFEKLKNMQQGLETEKARLENVHGKGGLFKRVKGLLGK